MSSDELLKLKQLRDYLVDERRQMVAALLAEMNSSENMASEFIGLQNFVDAVEKALSHETMLERQEGLSAASRRSPLK